VNLRALFRGPRLRALALDTLIWAYLPAAILYYYREALRDNPLAPWLYAATIPLGLIVAVVLERGGRRVGGRSLGESAVGLEAPAAVEGAPQRRPPWYRTQIGWTAVLLSVVTLVLGWDITEIDLYSVFTRADKMGNVVERLVRPYWPVLGDLIGKMIETIFLALMSTVLSIPPAVVVAFLAARNLMIRLTAPRSRLLGWVVLGVVGAAVGVRLVGLAVGLLDGARFDVPLLTGIFAPLFALLGLAGGAWFGGWLVARLERSSASGGLRAMVVLLSAVLGCAAAYLLA